MSNDNQPIIVEPEKAAQYSIIWLHGLGADGNDFVPIVNELNPLKHPIRFVFPHAPIRPVTLNQGMMMRAWFDIIAIDPNAPEDIQGLQASQKLIHELIATEKNKGIEYQNIFLAGFSQGGALALYTGLRYPEQLAGVIALSCFLPSYQQLLTERSLVNNEIPIFMAHGNADNILPMILGQATKTFLQQAGYPVEWHEYPMQHQVCIEEIQAVSTFIHRNLK
ncbi:MAG: alpha/beta hydrolase-fold protein [Pseudomonadota bacterium]